MTFLSRNDSHFRHVKHRVKVAPLLLLLLTSGCATPPYPTQWVPSRTPLGIPVVHHYAIPASELAACLAKIDSTNAQWDERLGPLHSAGPPPGVRVVIMEGPFMWRGKLHVGLAALRGRIVWVARLGVELPALAHEYAHIEYQHLESNHP